MENIQLEFLSMPKKEAENLNGRILKIEKKVLYSLLQVKESDTTILKGTSICLNKRNPLVLAYPAASRFQTEKWPWEASKEHRSSSFVMGNSRKEFVAACPSVEWVIL